MPRGAVGGSFGQVGMATEPEVTYDTYRPVTDVYGGTNNVDGAIAVGTRFRRVGSSNTLRVHGVRWWRSTTPQAAAPVTYLAAVGGAVLTSEPSPLGAGAPAAAGWETVLFDTPVDITSGEHVVWVWLPSGGYPATAAYFTAAGNHVSVPNGLFDNPTGAGRYRQPPAGTNGDSQPVDSFNSGYYWVDPLVTLAP